MLYRVRAVRFGFHLSTAGTLLKAVEQAVQRGCDALQIFVGSPRSWERRAPDLQEAEGFRRKVEEIGLRPVIIHSPYLVNLASPDPRVRRRSVRAVLFDLRAGALLGADFVVVHMGHHKGAGEKEGICLLRRSLLEIMGLYPKGGPVLLVENSSGAGTEIGFQPRHWEEALSGLPQGRVGLCLDLAHAHQAFCDLSQPKGAERLLKEVRGAVGLERLKLLHLSDSKSPPLSKVDRHEHLGCGSIGKEGLRWLVNHEAFSSLAAILETPTMDLALDLRNLEFVRSLV